MQPRDETIAARLGAVRERIAEACRRAGRGTDEVTLLAVSKTQPAEALREAWEAGQRAFGESYLQEALDKIEALRGLTGVEWHFIGPLQSNKTRRIAGNFQWVHGVDRLKVARRLSEQRPEGLPPLSVCIQVNTSGEASKAGVHPEELPALAEAVAELPRLHLRGLMTIPAPASTLEAQRRPFRLLRRLLEALQERGLPLDTLSMGMSGDLEAAILEGATLVRVGTAIFGPRRAPGGDP